MDGRVHTSAYKRVLDHFPDLGIRPRLVAASDLSPERRRHAELMGFARTSQDWRTVIDDPAVDVVSVTTPNSMHAEVAIAAAEADKHVWVEKPVGRDLGEATAVADAARRAGVINAVGFCYRFVPAVQHARALIASGRSATSTTTAASFSPTTRTARIRRPPGAFGETTPALARSAT
jgi:predicted dehydrogenase